MKKLAVIVLSVLAIMSCGRVVPSGKLVEDYNIFPDYKEVTVPPNIAPLNFCMSGSSAYALTVEGAGAAFSVKSRKGCFHLPAGKWKRLLKASKGSDLHFSIAVRQDGKWLEMNPFTIHVAEEEASPYIAYRLIPPGYGMWRRMGIYQRNIESFRQTPVYENKLTGDNCVNCHSFPSRDPSSMVFHMRARNGGTVLIEDGEVHKLNTKTDSTISNLVYPYWHPSGKFIAFSVNKTFQTYHMTGTERIEVYDSASDVVVLDLDAREILSCPLLKSGASFETFPSFSPDGKSLYFCTSKAVGEMPADYMDVHYSLCRIDFDPDTRSFGEKVDTLFNAGDCSSVSFPRVSPDGRFLVFTRHEFGTFSIWHSDADLWCVDLSDGRLFPLTAANSPESTDSYHSWSAESRWLVFSSRRADGLYTRPYFTYVSEDGTASKAFMLPQKNPRKYYRELMFSYNIPEFIDGKVKSDRHGIASVMRRSEGGNLTYHLP